jgi:hypothetical protein
VAAVDTAGTGPPPDSQTYSPRPRIPNDAVKPLDDLVDGSQRPVSASHLLRTIGPATISAAPDIAVGADTAGETIVSIAFHCFISWLRESFTQLDWHGSVPCVADCGKI